MNFCLTSSGASSTPLFPLLYAALKRNPLGMVIGTPVVGDVGLAYERATITYIASLPAYTGPDLGEPLNLDPSDDEGSKRQKPKPIKAVILFMAAQPRKSLPSSGTIANARE